MHAVDHFLALKTSSSEFFHHIKETRSPVRVEHERFVIHVHGLS